MSQDRANTARAQIIHRHLQRKFTQHRDRLEAHKAKGGVFAQAVEELERKLFPPTPPVVESGRDVVEGFAKKFGVTLPDD